MGKLRVLSFYLLCVRIRTQVALVFGNEHRGVSPAMQSLADWSVSICAMLCVRLRRAGKKLPWARRCVGAL